MLTSEFFSRDAAEVAKCLLGKIIRHKYKKQWLSARIIETEAYYLNDKASHSSLGYTEKRKAMFMPPATIYMYYARGHDSLNISVGSEGDAVLIKAAYPFTDAQSPQDTIRTMQKLNPAINGKARPEDKLCAGQTLLCKSLNIKVADWDKQQFKKIQFYIEDIKLKPEKIIQTYRLGIRDDRDAHHLYRFIDYNYAKYCTKNPLTSRTFIRDKDYFLLKTQV